MGETTVEMVKTMISDTRQADAKTAETRTLLSRQIDEANDLVAGVSQIVTRGRSGIRAAFRPDSPQYAQVGGTRASQRKPPTRKKPPAKGSSE
jgi:hypothetical protein